MSHRRHSPYSVGVSVWHTLTSCCGSSSPHKADFAGSPVSAQSLNPMGKSVRWTPLPQAEAPTEATAKTAKLNSITNQAMEIVNSEVIFEL